MIARIAALAAALAALSGCILAAAAIVAAAVTVGTVSYANNVAACDYGAPIDRVWEASLGAAADCGYPPGSQSRDYQYAELQTRAGDNRQVVVTCRRIDDASTRVEVRVGDFESDANRSSAEALHDAIQKRLGVKREEPGPSPSARNQMRRHYQADYESAWAAARVAMKNLAFPIDRENRDALKGEIAGHRADTTPVTITVAKLENKRTSIVVEVGSARTEENKRAARAVHDEIARSLGAPEEKDD